MKNSLEVQCSASAEGVSQDTSPPRTVISLFGAGFHGWKLAAMVQPCLREQGWDAQAQLCSHGITPRTPTRAPAPRDDQGHLSSALPKAFYRHIKISPYTRPGTPATMWVLPLSLLFPFCILILQIAWLRGEVPVLL